MIERYTEIRIWCGNDYGYSIEDSYKDVGGDGLTISAFEVVDRVPKPYKHICFGLEEGVAVMSAMFDLLPKNLQEKFLEEKQKSL